MAQASLLELAKQGKPDAIAALMNRTLQARGIHVQASRWQDCLTVMAAAATPPDRAFIMHFVRQGMLNLGAESVREVVVQGYGQSTLSPAWEDRFDLSLDRTATRLARRSRGEAVAPAAAAATASTATAAATAAPADAVRKPGAIGTAPHPSRSPTSPASPAAAPAVATRSVGVQRILGYGALVLAVVALTAAVRFGIVWLAETVVYQVPYAGDFLRNVEIAELLNLLVFAIPGMGLGLAAGLLRLPWGVRVSALLLTALVPLIFAISPWVRYELWLSAIAEEQSIPAAEARTAADAFLEGQVGDRGAWGFYRFAARFPTLPASAEAMQEVELVDRQVTATLADLTDWEPERISRLLEACNWGVRAFYFLVAAVTAIVHFHEGVPYGLRWFVRPASPPANRP